jgi:phage shock protein PspC (stress-responsive transcriptional regulator)
LKLDEGDVFCSKCGKATRADAPPRAESGQRRLVRSVRDKKIAGVCAGFANYLGVDVTLVRIIWLMVVFFGGTGFIAYIIAWIAMPKENEAGTQNSELRT